MGFWPPRRGPVSLGVFVEGPSDRHTILILVRKPGYSEAIHASWVRGNLLGYTEMSHQIESLLARQPAVNLILVLIDSEGVDPARTLRSTESVAAHLN